MKKVKRLMAVLLTLAMVLGMSVMTFAAPDSTTTITVKGVEGTSKVHYERIIEPDSSTPTGWAFVKDSEAAKSFKEAIKPGAKDVDTYDQQIIAGLIINKDPSSAGKISVTPITINDLEKALKAPGTLKEDNVVETPNAAGEFEITGAGAGFYIIYAGDVTVKDNGQDKLIAYSPMAAYVGFTYENGVVNGLESAVEATAKKSEYPFNKSDDEDDDVTAVGDIVEYTLTTKIPDFSEVTDVSTITFKIVDTIKGAQYVKSQITDYKNGPKPENVELAKNTGDKVAVEATIDGESIPLEAELLELEKGASYDYSFELNLEEFARTTDESGTSYKYANKDVIFTYKAYVTATEVENDATLHHNDFELKSKTNNYTGTLKLTKKNGDTNGEPLAGAKFVLYYTSGTGDDVKTYCAVTTKASDGNYTVTGWEQKNLDKDDLDSLLLETIEDGTVTVKGLEDDRDRTYEFKEVVAPDGYSVNTTPVSVKEENWNDRENPITANDRLGEVEMYDTQLSALPDTGGIGTTIFTIVGCLIMIAAAGLFFASRRKTEK